MICVVSCGMRQQETLNLLKSAIIFGLEHRLRFIVMTEDNLMAGFREKLEDWANIVKHQFTFQVLPLIFPKENGAEWRNLFKPCAAQRLFLPVSVNILTFASYYIFLCINFQFATIICSFQAILTDVDSVLYMDTDTLFTAPVIDVWNFFRHFNATQIAGLSPEHEDTNVGWYNRFSRHPYYGKLGVNSGVMLMNLTRMREFKWNLYMLPLFKEYKLKITWGDQDLINILFAYYPERLYVFPCQFNYRPDHCMYMSVCDAPNGIQILHGNRGYFHSEKQPIFSAIYHLIENYQLGTDLYRNLVEPLESTLSSDDIQHTSCGKIHDKFLKQFKNVFKENVFYDDENNNNVNDS